MDELTLYHLTWYGTVRYGTVRYRTGTGTSTGYKYHWCSVQYLAIRSSLIGPGANFFKTNPRLETPSTTVLSQKQ
jgi:hypothetical protein